MKPMGALGATLAVAAGLLGSEPTERPLALSALRSGGSVFFSEVHPRTLEPRGRSVEVGEHHGTWAFSPDGSLLALGTSRPGGATARIGLMTIDMSAMRVHRYYETGIAAEAFGWLGPNRLAAALQSGEIVVADPRTGEIVERWDAGKGARFWLPEGSSAHGRFVALLRAFGREQPTRLVVLDRNDGFGKITLRQVRSGQRSIPAGRSVTEQADVVVDQQGETAYVLGSRGRLAVVNLSTMDVEYRKLTGDYQQSLGGFRQLIRLPGNRLCSVGYDYFHGHRYPLPAGASIIDTRNGLVRSIDPRAGAARLVGKRLYTYSPRPGDGPGAGLGVFRPSGRRLATLFAGRKLDFQAAHGYGYAIERRRLHVLNLHSRNIVQRTGRPRAAELDLVTRSAR